MWLFESFSWIGVALAVFGCLIVGGLGGALGYYLSPATEPLVGWLTSGRYWPFMLGIAVLSGTGLLVAAFATPTFFFALSVGFLPALAMARVRGCEDAASLKLRKTPD